MKASDIIENLSYVNKDAISKPKAGNLSGHPKEKKKNKKHKKHKSKKWVLRNPD